MILSMEKTMVVKVISELKFITGLPIFLKTGPREFHCHNIIPMTHLNLHDQWMIHRYHIKSTFSTLFYLGCGGNIYDSNTVITSPNYPENYPNDAKCEWFIFSGSVNTLKLWASYVVRVHVDGRVRAWEHVCLCVEGRVLYVGGGG